MTITKEIYLIRHGETEYNKLGIVQGSGLDAPLNEKGQRQAEAFFKMYGDVAFDKIYASQLKRSYQSIAGFEKKGIPLEKYEGLNEISWGKFEKKQMDTFDRQYLYDLIESWKAGEVDKPIFGGESPLDVQKRQQPVIDLILSRTEEKKILICMHGRAMRVLLCTLLGKPLTEMESFPHHNLGLYHLILDDEGSLETQKENCIAHLAHEELPLH